MDSRTRVLQAMRRQGRPDRPPFEISWGAFTPSLMNVYRKETGSTTTPEEYFDFDTRSVEPNPTRKKTDFSSYYSTNLKGDSPIFAARKLGQSPDAKIGTVPVPPNAIFDEWGCGSVPGSFEHFVEFKYHPLQACKTPEEIASFPWPDLTAEYRYEGLADRVAEYHRRGYAVNGELYMTIFERAWLMRGMEPLLMDFLAEPEIGHAICRSIADLRIIQARRLAALDVDMLRLGDDVCTQKGLMMSLATYRTFLKEPTREIIRAAKQVKPDLLIFMHCDGRVGDFVEELIDIGVDILNPVQPECNDLESLAKRFQGRISFWGGIGTQSVMPFGTPAEVAAEVRRIADTLGRDGGLLLAPTHILEPDVPWENVLAFVKAAKECLYEER